MPQKEKTRMNAQNKTGELSGTRQTLQKVITALEKRCIVMSFLQRAEKVVTTDNSEKRSCVPFTYLISPNKNKPGKSLS